ncbi:acyltransferase family protein [Haloprofundus halobius]|uniref:acyltransferase family protein n=1 Tax=Haloprofundus halobius TaxID=2876194 RepID=UPI001CCCF4EB|nr:acyltransferase [Haloprofundus halobius]
MGDRLHSVDTLRAVAMFFIVVAHVQPFRGFGTYGNHVYFALDTIGQFDVPFFFAASGYFLAKSMDADSAESYVKGAGRKLGSLYLFGILLYLAATALVALLQGVDVVNALLARRLGDPSLVGFLYYGDTIGVPLWFLTALFFSICFVALFVRFEKTRYLLPVAALFHVVGLVGTNLQMLVEIPFETRDALFFGFFYVALGYRLSASDWTPSEDRSRLYLGVVCLLVVLQLAEQYAIGYLLRDATLSQAIISTEYTLSTVFFVFALFAYGLSKPGLGKRTVLPRIGRHAVGIYLVHVPLYRIIQAVNRIWGPAVGIDFSATLLWQLAITPLVYTLSLGVYLLMARAGVIELGGSHFPWLARLRAQITSLVSTRGSETN